MNLFIKKPHQPRPSEDSVPPIELSGRTKWTISTANLWMLITILASGILAYSHMEADNRVRDLKVDVHSDQISAVVKKVGEVDTKVTETRELMIKMSGQLDSIAQEQRRQYYRGTVPPVSPAVHPN